MFSMMVGYHHRCRGFLSLRGLLPSQGNAKGWKSGVGGHLPISPAVPLWDKLSAGSIGFRGLEVPEVVFLVADQQVARVHTVGVVALMTHDIVIAERDNRRDGIREPVRRQGLFLELYLCAWGVTEPKAAVSIQSGLAKDDPQISIDSLFHML